MATDALIATLVLGGMCFAMWWLARLAKRRMGVGSGTVSSAGLRVVGKRPLDPKSSLFVVEIAGGRHILVGASIEGGVSKIDDISPEEFAAMASDEPAASGRPRLRVASRGTDGDGEGDADGAAQQKFATVSESFSLLLGKARSARGDRSDRHASGE